LYAIGAVLKIYYADDNALLRFRTYLFIYLYTTSSVNCELKRKTSQSAAILPTSMVNVYFAE